MNMKTVWLDCYARVVLTSPQELANHREDCIQRDMKTFGDTREEAEHDIDWYFNENVVSVEVDLDSSYVFWVDYTNREIMTEEAVCEQAEYAYSIEEWLNENYSAAKVFLEIQRYGFDSLIDGYLQSNFEAFVQDNELEYLEIDD